MTKTLYKRNAQGRPIQWSIEQKGNELIITHGVVGTNLHREVVDITLVKANEFNSRITAKRKEGYKELSELKDNHALPTMGSDYDIDITNLYNYLFTYLPVNNTTTEGFILPMLAKTLEDNKPFEKHGALLGQYKINGLRCLIGAKQTPDMFNPIYLTYHSRTGENWTDKLHFMDEFIVPALGTKMLEAMLYEDVYLDGELYLPGYSVNDINSFVKNIELAGHYNLQYWCYDIGYENMSAVNRMQFRLLNIQAKCIRFNSKEEHLNNKEKFVLLPTIGVDSITSAIDTRDCFIDLGFEGLILRNPTAEYQFGKRNQAMFKFKKIDDGYFEVLDIKEDKRGLPVYVLKNDINNELFECTINLPQDKQRQQLELKQYLIGKKALVEYRERSGVKQVPFHAKIIKIIV